MPLLRLELSSALREALHVLDEARSLLLELVRHELTRWWPEAGLAGLLLLFGVVLRFFHRGVDIVGAGNASALAGSRSGVFRVVDNQGQNYDLGFKTRMGLDACVEPR